MSDKVKSRYEVREALGQYRVIDNLTGKKVTRVNFLSYDETKKYADKLNMEDVQKTKSAKLIQLAGIGGHGVNLYNAFNFIDMWEVMNWFFHNEFVFYGLFDTWWQENHINRMESKKAQTVIVDKIYELLDDAGMLL